MTDDGTQVFQVVVESVESEVVVIVEAVGATGFQILTVLNAFACSSVKTFSTYVCRELGATKVNSFVEKGSNLVSAKI